MKLMHTKNGAICGPPCTFVHKFDAHQFR